MSKQTKTKGQFGVERDHDVPWNQTKVAVFVALKKLGAVSASTGKPAVDVAKQAKVTARDVRHYVYHGKAGGLADVTDGENGRVYFLTAKGAILKPAALLKAQQASSNGKE